ncbi:MAG: nucleotidyl transferase AbiEii/AbiGii toxin family protein [Candidatus Sumerlaeota bacterium]|nr:nucleotidyl transferase AbiEii/AbiGii toxin family protein [Candidatus Sumerlaeota bacterium]
MQEAIAAMLAKYECRTLADSTHALREIIQEVALLGLWRAKFFENAAFYGGSALRILYGLDRYSEDLDFSLLKPQPDFKLERYTAPLKKEIMAFGFDVRIEMVDKAARTPIQSAFLKLNARSELLVIETPVEIAQKAHRNQSLKIKIEVDTDPPPGFSTATRYLLHPIPFPVRIYSLPDLFAGKIHAALFRRWKNRVKGRDWYDFVWYAANHPQLHLAHLEQRMRQTGNWAGQASLARSDFEVILNETIDGLDIEQARREVAPFVKRQEDLAVWSKEFLKDVARRIQII